MRSYHIAPKAQRMTVDLLPARVDPPPGKASWSPLAGAGQLSAQHTNRTPGVTSCHG